MRTVTQKHTHAQTQVHTHKQKEAFAFALPTCTHFTAFLNLQQFYFLGFHRVNALPLFSLLKLVFVCVYMYKNTTKNLYQMQYI